MNELYTIFNLMADLEALIEKHPDVDFTTLEVALNSEYTCGGVELSNTGYGTFVDILGG